MSGKASRAKGHKYEVKICSELRAMGFEAVTSRSESKRLDDAGVDCVTNLPFHFQMKATEATPPYCKLLPKMPDDKTRVILHKMNNKPEIAVLLKKDFYMIMKAYVRSLEKD